MALTDSLCAHENPVVAYRARRLLAGESESSQALRRLRRAIGSSEMAKRLLLALTGERTVLFPDQPLRPRRCASMEGNTIWSQLVLGIVPRDIRGLGGYCTGRKAILS